MGSKKMLGVFGVGGPSVDTVLTDPNTRPGAVLHGGVRLQGGKNDVDIEHVAVGLVTRVEVEHGDADYDAIVEFHRLPVCGGLHLSAGAGQAIPFQFPVPWETPVTAVYGQHLHGMTMGLRTEVAIARAVDKGDLDPVYVHPLPAQETILEAMGGSGSGSRAPTWNARPPARGTPEPALLPGDRVLGRAAIRPRPGRTRTDLRRQPARPRRDHRSRQAGRAVHRRPRRLQPPSRRPGHRAADRLGRPDRRLAPAGRALPRQRALRPARGLRARLRPARTQGQPRVRVRPRTRPWPRRHGRRRGRWWCGRRAGRRLRRRRGHGRGLRRRWRLRGLRRGVAACAVRMDIVWPRLRPGPPHRRRAGPGQLGRIWCCSGRLRVQLALVAVLVAANAAFAGSEIALISLRESQLRALSPPPGCYPPTPSPSGPPPVPRPARARHARANHSVPPDVSSNGVPIWCAENGQVQRRPRMDLAAPGHRSSGTTDQPDAQRFLPLRRGHRDRRYPLITQLRKGAARDGHWFVVDTDSQTAGHPDQFRILDHRTEIAPPDATWAPGTVTACAVAGGQYSALVADGNTVHGDDVLARFDRPTVAQMISDLDAVCRESAVIRRYRREALGEVKTGLLGVEARWAEFASWTADNVGDRQAAAFWLDRAVH